MNTTSEKYSKNRELIILAQSEDEETSMRATEQLLEANMGLVRSLALRFRDRGTETEDLIQIGTIGIIKAIRSFDLERETAFSTYAVPLIVGEIRRHLRDSGIIKVSRYHKKLGMEILAARNKIQSIEGRDPRIEELASICGVSTEEAAIALDAVTPVSSLSDSYCGDENATVESRLADTDNEIEKISNKIAIAESISKMSEQWRKIVLLRFYRNMTQQATAEVLGLSQVKVSREEKKILDFLRGELAN